MKIQCVTKEDAEAVALLMKRVGAKSPAAAEIVYIDVPQPEWWAVESSDDLDTIKGHVESLTVL